MRDLQMAFISNRTTSRLFRILSTIERDRIFTIGDLAEQNQVTQRTIASDIKYIKEYFAESISLLSGNSGFIFEEKQSEIYKKRKQNLLKNECLFEIIGNIFHGKLAKVDELAHHYHFSESTFRRLLNQRNPILKSYGLQWTSNPLTIEGREANLRKFFKDFYYEGAETIFTMIPDPELHELILEKLQGQTGDYDLGSGVTPAAFNYTFYIAIKRASLGCSIDLPEELAELAYKSSGFSALCTLKEDIERIYELQLSKEEFAWIYLVTLCKRTFNQEEQEQKFYQHFNRGSEIADMTALFLRGRDVPQEKQATIQTFLRSFFLSRKLNHQITPVLNKEMSDIKEAIMRSNCELYQKNLDFLEKHRDKLALNISYLEDVCVSLTLYSELIFDFYASQKTVYFLLEGDHFVCQHIQIRALRQFGNRHSLTFIPLQYLTKEALNETHIDMVVTNYPRYLSDYHIETEYFLLKPLPDEQDWDYLERKLSSAQSPLF